MNKKALFSMVIGLSLVAPAMTATVHAAAVEPEKEAALSILESIAESAENIRKELDKTVAERRSDDASKLMALLIQCEGDALYESDRIKDLEPEAQTRIRLRARAALIRVKASLPENN